MKKTVFAAVLALTAAAAAVTASAADFADVPESSWAYAAVSELAADGTVNGREDGSFDPEATVTRAEFAKMTGVYDVYVTDTQASNLSSGAAVLLDDDKTEYADVASDAWYAEYAGLSGLDPDEDGNFRPNEAITRSDALEILYKRAGSPKGCDAPDAVKEQGDADMCAWGYENGIMRGNGDDDLRLSETITRAEAAAVIVRARRIVKAYGTYVYSDVTADGESVIQYKTVYQKNTQISGNSVKGAYFEVSADDRTENESGGYTYNHKSVSADILDDSSAYPDNYENYPYILADVPQGVYTTAYADIEGTAVNPFRIYYSQSRTSIEFADMFMLPLESYITRVENESGVKLKLAYYPSLVYNYTGHYYVMRVKCTVLDAGSGTLTYKDVFQEENDTVLTDGYEFWTDVVTDYAFGLGIGGMFGFGNALDV